MRGWRNLVHKILLKADNGGSIPTSCLKLRAVFENAGAIIAMKRFTMMKFIVKLKMTKKNHANPDKDEDEDEENGKDSATPEKEEEAIPPPIN